MIEIATALFGGAVLIGLAILFVGYRIAAVVDRRTDIILTAPLALADAAQPGDCEMPVGPKTQAALDAATAAIKAAVSAADQAGFERGQAAAADQAATDDADSADAVTAAMQSAGVETAPATPAADPNAPQA